MNHRKKTNRPSKSSSSVGAPRDLPSAVVGIPNHVEAVLTRVIRHVSAGNCPKALDLLRNTGGNPQLRNALGVCLLRMGRYEDATRILRDLVLSPGCTWVRQEVPTIYKINFALALLLGGHPGGCQEILSETKDKTNPSVQRLQTAIKRWETNLPWRKRLMWRLGGIEPSNCPVTLDFPPGDFDLAVTTAEAPPTANGISASPSTAL